MRTDGQNGNTTLDTASQATLPVSLVPTPTIDYRIHRKFTKATVGAGIPTPVPIPPLPTPLLSGPRVLIWKQDPSVLEIGIRKAYLPRPVQVGPRDGRVRTAGLPSVSPNVFGDFIETPNTDAFDTVHTFAVVRQTLDLYLRALSPSPVRWQWNSTTNTDPLDVYAHAGETMNAYYSRSQKVLKFFYFNRPGSNPPQRIFTCRSFDIVAHECGHAILDGLKPNWILTSNAPQTGALHESFGDLTAIFLTLSQLDQVEAIIAQTKARLHDKTFLSDLAEQFGLALGRPNGLRNADNNLKLGQVGTEVHDLSQVFTGGIYDVLADIFAIEYKLPKDPAAVLYEVGRYVCSLVLRGIQAAPASNATFADVINAMLQVTVADGKPATYRNSIRNQFTLRGVVVSPTPLKKETEASAEVRAVDHPSLIGTQTRNACCGTMQSLEYNTEVNVDAELEELQDSLS